MDTLSPRDRETKAQAPAEFGSPTKGPAVAVDTESSPKFSLQDDDLALARILQEQERAFHLLQLQQLQEASRQHAALQGEYDEAQEEGEGEEDGSMPLTDEELARRLQEQERMESFRALYAAQGIDFDNLDREVMGADTEALGYEDLNTLGEVAGKVSKGLPAHAIDALPVHTYTEAVQDCSLAGDTTKCCICQLEFESEDEVTPLPCWHLHHQACLAQWLMVNKVCPVCSKEVPKE